MKIIPLFMLLLSAGVARSQQKDAFYLLDAKWQPTQNKDSAHYFIRLRKVSETCWQWDYYNLSGPLLRSEQYKDRAGNLQQGTSYYYDNAGRLDSSVLFANGKKNGNSFTYKGDSMRVKYKYVYRDDSLVDFVDFDKLPQKKDDSVEVESEYPGGTGKWIRYLNKNLKYPDRAINGNIQGQVRVLFIVDKDGTVVQPIICHSVEYSIDDESLRIVRESGKWTPAVQHGQIVKSYKLQPIVFKLE